MLCAAHNKKTNSHAGMTKVPRISAHLCDLCVETKLTQRPMSERRARREHAMWRMIGALNSLLSKKGCASSFYSGTISGAMSDFVMKSIARVVPDVAGPFQHTFGGTPTHRGIKPRGSSQPLHLLYTFDMKDPLVPIRMRGVRYLPLYYGFVYNAGAVGYRVVSDDEIQILYMETKRVEPDFPYENYPGEFPEVPVSLTPISYEDHKTLVYYLECEDYGLKKHLSEADKTFLKETHYPFTQLGGIQRMWQGVPQAPCPDKKCECHKYDFYLEVFAVVWNRPVPNVYLWDNDRSTRDNLESQVIFQICPECRAIYVCNRCT